MIYTRIALVGSPASLKTQTAELLSDKLNLDCVSIAKDFEFSLPDHPSFKCMKISQMLTGLAYFHERIRNESPISFISDGSAIHEFILAKAQTIVYNIAIETRGSLKLFTSEQEFEDRFVKIVAEYINKTYDRIYLIQNDIVGDNKDKILDNIFRCVFISLAKKTNIKYICLEGSTEELIDQIVKKNT